MASTLVLTSFRRCGFCRSVAIPSGPSVDSMRNVVMRGTLPRRVSGSHPPERALGGGDQPHALVLGHVRHDLLVPLQVVGVTLDVVHLDAMTLSVPYDTGDLPFDHRA